MHILKLALARLARTEAAYWARDTRRLCRRGDIAGHARRAVAPHVAHSARGGDAACWACSLGVGLTLEIGGARHADVVIRRVGGWVWVQPIRANLGGCACGSGGCACEG